AFVLTLGRPWFEIRPQDATNLLAGVAMLLLVLGCRRRPAYFWALAPLAVLWSNLHGGYVYIVVQALGFALGAWVARRFVEPRGGRDWSREFAPLGFSLLAGLLGSAVFSPYHLANVTQSFAAPVGPNSSLWQTVEEWQPLLRTLHGPRSGLRFVLFLGFLAVLAVGRLLLAPPARLGTPRRLGSDHARGLGPDEVTLLVAALPTFAMTFSSQRFVPLGLIAGAPLLALWLDHVMPRLAATHACERHHAATGLQRSARLAVPVALTAVSIAFAIRARTAYIDPWPFSRQRVSVFERMTWAHRRPADVCRFLTANELTGRIFNPWVEGSYLAWCQVPTAGGALPIRTMIDGRAQEAFTAETYAAYSEMAAGGPPGFLPLLEGRSPAVQEIRQMATWLEARLRSMDVWLALVPEEDASSGYARALFATGSWRIAYFGRHHALLVDSSSPAGSTLLTRIRAGTAAFPDEASRTLALASSFLAGPSPKAANEALDLAIRSYGLDPTPAAVRVALACGRTEPLRGRVRSFAESVVADHLRVRGQRARLAGLLVSNTSARIALSYLSASRGADAGMTAGIPIFQLREDFEREAARESARGYWD
ncbi:MAG: hypothetical protein ACOY3Y_17505, partial [Acidobacteriota bacterium]